MSDHAPVKRKAVRFRPDEGTIAMLSFKGDSDVESGMACLVIDESRTGCSLATVSAILPVSGTLCRVRVGKLAAITAEIRWASKIDARIIKFGVEYLE